MTDYTSMFKAHDSGRDRRRNHAVVLAEMLMPYHQPESVIDLGCGMGFFLSAMQERGVEIHGVDGPWVNELELEVDAKHYTIQDLNSPYSTTRRYGLASSLEVAEHLKPERSDDFVAELTALSDYVLFSAAIPNQKGHGHINCQWQGAWAERFAAQGYRCYDPFRRRLVGVPEMAQWFMQNLLLFVRDGAEVSPLLAEHEIPAKAASYMLPRWHNQRVNFLGRRVKAFRSELRNLQAQLGLEPVDPDLRDPARIAKQAKAKQAAVAGSAAQADPAPVKSPADLTVLPGIGPILDRKLKNAGISQIDEIASWKDQDIIWAEQNVGPITGKRGWAGCVNTAKTLVTSPPDA